MKLLHRIAAALLVLPTTALAIDFDLTDTEGRYEMHRDYSAGGINLSITGYTGGYYDDWAGREFGADIHRTAVGAFGSSGLGVENANSPNHAADNGWPNFDMMLLTFDQAVSLDTASIGWHLNDSDLTILAYTGTGSATDTFAGNKWDDALAQNWDGGHFLDVASQDNTAVANPKGLTSTSWLVGTQLWSLDNVDVLSKNPNRQFGTDYIKLAGISVTSAHSVPEIDASQSGIALGLLLGLMACIRERRKKQA